MLHVVIARGGIGRLKVVPFIIAAMIVSLPAASPAGADTTTLIWDVKFCAPNSTVIGDADSCTPVDVVAGAGAASAYDYVSYLELDAAGGPGGTPVQPYLDVMTTSFQTDYGTTDGLIVNPGAAIGAISGEIEFHFESNTPSVNPGTGGVDACGVSAAGYGGSASLYHAAASPVTPANMTSPSSFYAGGPYVQSFDDDDGDLVEYTTGFDANDPTTPPIETPESQEDGIDLNGDADYTDANEVAPNGILLGAERQPDYLGRFYQFPVLGPFVAERSFGAVQVQPGVAIDVNVILLDLTEPSGVPAAPGYYSLTLFGIPQAGNKFNPATVLQTLRLCTPFQSRHTTFGITRNNPATAPNEAGFVARGVSGSFDYVVNTSTTHDPDNDGVAYGIDRCDRDSGAGLDGADGDGISGGCDSAPATSDNCAPGGPFITCPFNVVIGNTLSEGSAASNGSLCTASPEAVGPEGGSYSTRYPWDMDQDVDCDGAANFFDNCPQTYNPSQRDNDHDALGNTCDVRPLENACGGDGSPANGFPSCPIPSQGHDHDGYCRDSVDASAGATESYTAGSSTICNQTGDSNDDAVLDWEPAAMFPGAPIDGQEDINSDSDFDGCPDKDERDIDITCGSLTSSPAGNALNADVDGDGIMDGAEDRDGDTIIDWRDSIGEEPQTSIAYIFSGEGSPDSDADGCTNRRENLTADISGGNRNALNPYDFPDIPTPSNGPLGTDGKPTLSSTAVRNRAISLMDVGVVISYVGRSSTNSGAAYYNGDLNGDDIADGHQMDRTPGAGNNEAAGNLAISLTDVAVVLEHVGDNCQTI